MLSSSLLVKSQVGVGQYTSEEEEKNCSEDFRPSCLNRDKEYMLESQYLCFFQRYNQYITW